jgi:hypothetical protein
MMRRRNPSGDGNDNKNCNRVEDNGMNDVGNDDHPRVELETEEVILAFGIPSSDVRDKLAEAIDGLCNRNNIDVDDDDDDDDDDDK